MAAADEQTERIVERIVERIIKRIARWAAVSSTQGRVQRMLVWHGGTRYTYSRGMRRR